jgi:hypothetical protein
LQLEGLHARLVSGNPIFTERIGALGDQQIRIPPSRAFWQYCPGNLRVIDFQIMDLPEVRTAYVMPLCTANLQIDDDIADCLVAFLRCCDHPISMEPSRQLLRFANKSTAASLWVKVLKRLHNETGFLIVDFSGLVSALSQGGKYFE